MPGAAVPIRIDRELDASAREAARAMSRSVSEQVSHWARLGRELERSPDVSVARVQAVLAGERRYDELNPPEQAFVRTAWDEQIAERLANLDLAADFEAQGHSWAELAEDGSLRIVEPAKKR
jgi:predicted S18 family serine protease